jgi:dTDP-glucose 4,6-dehydratase
LNPRGNNKSYKELIKFVDDRPGHDYRYAVNCNKISNTLEWNAQISFDDGIEKTVKWYVDHSDWWGKIIEKKYNLERLGTVK